LKKDTVVVTVMSNLGLKQALVKNGVKVEETKVGDRYVLERMREVGAIIGGEQSGHVIFLEHNTTGDGIVTALKLLEVMQKTGKSLEELASQMEKLPQVLLNVRVKDKRDWEKNKAIRDVVALREKLLGDKGRILVRASGTEPLIRVMAEGNDLEELQQVTKEIAKVVEEELN
jgi:phosphoglucosamine mutase